jgi:predicted dehydrogenase
MNRRVNRRYFLQASAAAGAAALAGGRLLGEAKSDKLRVGMIGVGGMGGGNHDGILKAGADVIAICDIDDKTNANAAKKSPKAKMYSDFRKMLDEMGKELDAVVVSTPDNCHAAAAVMAMKMGLHCYCEKPLTHDVYEARVVRHVAASTKAKGGGKLQTQMGNRGTAESGFRRGVELLQAGVIGPVKEVYIWSNRPQKYWKQGMAERPPAETPPPNVHWDLWLGPAPERPYAKGYHPFAWRGWWDFGTGALGDMACHTANQAFMGLNLAAPKAVEFKGSKGGPATKESPPVASTILFEFPERGTGFPAVQVTWLDGSLSGNLPPERVLEQVKKLAGGKVPESGAIYFGEKGVMFAPDDYATTYKLLPGELNEAAKQVPVTLPRNKGGHYQEWVDACTGKIPQAMSNFDYAARLTDFVLLGNVAIRVGKRIEWDAEAMKATNCPEADQYIRREYRKGWTLDGTPA